MEPPGCDDLIGAHGGIADEDQHPVRAVAAQDLAGRHLVQARAAGCCATAAHRGSCGNGRSRDAGTRPGRRRRAARRPGHMIVHGAADIEQQQHLHLVVPLGLHLQVEHARRCAPSRGSCRTCRARRAGPRGRSGAGAAAPVSCRGCRARPRRRDRGTRACPRP